MKIFNRDFEQIQSAQQGGSLNTPVRHEDDIAKYREADMRLLDKYGSLDALKKMGYDGVVDRLERSGQSDKNKRA